MKNKNKRKIGIGIDNFKKLIESNVYYVDKTLLIKEIIDTASQITVITRPRRFGKTINMSMLKYYFEVPQMNEMEDNKYLFNGLDIFSEEVNEEYDYISECGTYPIIYLTLKNAKMNKWEDTYKNLIEIISDEYRRLNFLLESDVLENDEKELFKKIILKKADEIEYASAIINLSKYLYRYYKKKAIIIIDEYDTPMQSGYLNEYYKEVIEFIKSLLVKTFKDNKYYEKAIITGIMKVAKESIFSDFNNVKIYTVLDRLYKESFGFTEKEVEEMLNYYEMNEKLEEVKSWYNGYIFGLNETIYNPWSILNYVDDLGLELKPYWVNTAGRDLIKQVLQLDKSESKIVVEKLLTGEVVRKSLTEYIVYQNIENEPEAAWTFLLHSGYLKATDRHQNEGDITYNIQIPNIEIKTVYKMILKNYFREDIKLSGDIEELIYSLINGNYEEFKNYLKDIFFEYVSYYDTAHIKKNNNKEVPLRTKEDKDRRENFYHGFMLGLLIYANKYYEVISNREYGLGRPDIVMLSKNKENPSYVFEFKNIGMRSKITIEELLNNAKTQIKEKKYVEGVKTLHKIENVIPVAIAFKGKTIEIEV